MFWDKKGDFKYGTLAKIILVLIIGVIIIYATYMIAVGSGKGADIAACKAWTVFQSSIKDPALGIPLANFQNPCVTFKDTVEGNKLEVYKTLADTMHDTWKMYGQGKIDFFSDWDWFKKNTYCLNSKTGRLSPKHYKRLKNSIGRRPRSSWFTTPPSWPEISAKSTNWKN